MQWTSTCVWLCGMQIERTENMGRRFNVIMFGNLLKYRDVSTTEVGEKVLEESKKNQLNEVCYGK